MHRLLRLNLLVTGLVYLIGAAAALAQSPTLDDIQTQLRQQLPPYWTITDHRIVAEANRGDAVDPVWAQRQEMILTAAEPLYLRDREARPLGPFEMLVETTAQGTERTLYFVSTAERQGGAWQFRFEFENGVGRLGQPRDIFDAPTLVIGSDAYREAVETLSAPARAEARAIVDAQIAEVQAEGRAALAQLQAEIDAQVSSLAAARAARSAEADAAVAEEQASLAARLEEIRTQGAARIAEAEEAADAELAAAREAAQVYSELAAALSDREAAEAEAAAARASLYETTRDTRQAFIAEVIADLGSADAATRVAAFDAALAAGDAFSRARAVTAAFEGGDADLRAHALAHPDLPNAADLAVAGANALMARGALDDLTRLLDRVAPSTQAATAVAKAVVDTLPPEQIAPFLPRLIALGGTDVTADLAAFLEPFAGVRATIPGNSTGQSWPEDARAAGLDERGLFFTNGGAGVPGKTLLSHPPDRSTSNGFLIDTFGLPLALTVRSHERGDGTYAVFADGQEIHRETLDDNSFVRRIIEIPAGTEQVELRHIADEWSWEHLYFTEMGPAFD